MFWIALFLASVAVAVYVVFGYSALLALLARFRERPVEKRFERRTVSVVMAVHNGADFLAGKLQSVLALRYPRELIEILVVSDGSTDQTASIARQFGPLGVQLIELPRGGKPNALNAGIARARGEILLLTDVRQILDPDSLRYLVECFADPSVAVVSARMVIRKGHTHEEENLGLYWRYETWIRKQLGSMDSIFGASGALYAMRREMAVSIPADMLLDDMYLPLAAFFGGHRLIVEERARAYDYPTTLQTDFRRKVRTLAGNYQIMRAYPALLGPRNRLWLHFVSYKLGRLLLPYALIGLAVGSVGLPGGWAPAALAAQAMFYGLALVDPAVAQHSRLKHITSPIRTFVVLMAAALCAVSVFFVPPPSLWKPTSIAAKSRAAGA